LIKKAYGKKRHILVLLFGIVIIDKYTNF
jgi:hypothetical protein